MSDSQEERVSREVEKMTVKEFLQNYGGNECVSIEGYCEEKHYDYFREADGYASCYDDVSDIIEQLAAKNDIEQLSHYIYSHLCKYRPLKGLLKSVNIKAGKKLKLR